MKKYITILFIMINMLFSQSWMQSQIIERKFNQAVESYNEGKYATSLTILKKILADEPSLFEEPSLLLLLKSQVALNQLDQAKETTRSIFSKFPETIYLVNIMETLGDLYGMHWPYKQHIVCITHSRSLSQNIKKLKKLILSY